MIIMTHQGVTLRTGHKSWWWTAGLIFFGWIMLPVTAFGYKPTEVSPSKTNA